MLDNHLLPVPCFIINEQYEVQSASLETQELFGSVPSFVSLVDTASRTKLIEIIHPFATLSPVELNLLTSRGDLQLFDVYQRWSPEDRLGHLVCIPKDARIEAVARELRQIRELAAQPPAFPPEAPLHNAGRDAQMSKLRFHLATIRDILHILRPALVELNRSAYTELLTAELDAAEQLLLDDKKGTS